MRTIATLQDADAGTVHFGDIDVAKDPDALRRTLGYLPQEFGVYPSVTAEEVLNHIADLKGIGNKGTLELYHLIQELGAPVFNQTLVTFTGNSALKPATFRHFYEQLIEQLPKDKQTDIVKRFETVER